MTDDCETWYRVPRSAEECAVHLEAGGEVEWLSSSRREWEVTEVKAANYRMGHHAPIDQFRLVYSTPVGMSPVIGAPGHAYGLAQQAPEEWLGNFHGDVEPEPWENMSKFNNQRIIEARPPAPAPGPRTEKVPLHEVIGRTLPHGMSCDPNPPIQKVDSDFGGWWWYPDRTTDLRTTLNVVDGHVEVLAEGEA